MNNENKKYTIDAPVMVLILILSVSCLILIISFSALFYFSFRDLAFVDYKTTQLRVPEKVDVVADENLPVDEPGEVLDSNPDELVNFEETTKELKDQLEPKQNQLFSR